MQRIALGLMAVLLVIFALGSSASVKDVVVTGEIQVLEESTELRCSIADAQAPVSIQRTDEIVEVQAVYDTVEGRGPIGETATTADERAAECSGKDATIVGARPPDLGTTTARKFHREQTPRDRPGGPSHNLSVRTLDRDRSAGRL